MYLIDSLTVLIDRADYLYLGYICERTWYERESLFILTVPVEQLGTESTAGAWFPVAIVSSKNRHATGI